MIDYTIHDIVNNYLTFSKISQGWHVLYCEVCGDGSRTQGPRGGWSFDGDIAFYHCFNCGIKGSFDPTREFPFSKEMRKIFSSFAIPLNEIDLLIGKNNLNFNKTVPIKKVFEIPSIPIPDHFYRLDECDISNKIFLKAVKFLEHRQIDFTSYPFYLSTGSSTDGAENSIARSLINRLIIPALKDDKMIYYIARSLEDNPKEKSSKRYLNAHVPRTSVIYGYDKLFKDLHKPLYITEGFFDSWHLDGVAILENNLSHTQIAMLNRSPRRKIVVPDKKINKTKNDDGKKLATQAIELGWEISLPEFGTCTDVTEAIIKYGKLFVLNSIVNNIKSGFAAKVALEIW